MSFIKEIGKMVNDMEMVNKNILMMIFMKVIGIMIKKKELVAIFLKMEKNLKETSLMINI